MAGFEVITYGRFWVTAEGDCGAFLRHLDKNLAGRAIGVEPDDEITFVVGDPEVMRHGRPHLRKPTPVGARWSVEWLRFDEGRSLWHDKHPRPQRERLTRANECFT